MSSARSATPPPSAATAASKANRPNESAWKASRSFPLLDRSRATCRSARSFGLSQREERRDGCATRQAGAPTLQGERLIVRRIDEPPAWTDEARLGGQGARP